MRWVMRHLKRKHNALHVSLMWLEPWGWSAWAVWVFQDDIDSTKELARSSSLLVALVKALRAPAGGGA